MGHGRVGHVVRSVAVAALAAGALLVPAVGAEAAPALPRCAGAGPVRTLVEDSGALEAAAFDAKGRLLVTNWSANRIEILDRAGAAPRVLSPVKAPGGLAPTPDGSVLVGSGVALTAVLAPLQGFGELVRLDPDTGRTASYAKGLSMANGVVRAPDGTMFASDNAAPWLDKIDPDGTVHRGWLRDVALNGLAISPDGRTLYGNVSLWDTRILAIDTRTGAKRVFWQPPAALRNAFLDDLDIDAEGRLYAPAYLAGQVLRIDPDGSACTLATGLTFPAGLTLGHSGLGFSSGSVYVTTHAGKLLEIPAAVPPGGRA